MDLKMNKITLLPRPNNEYRTQEQSIALHNSRKELMLSLPNIYRLVKENNTAAIESLRKDFKDYVLITSTRIIYNAEPLSGRIIHNANSTKQKEIELKEIPLCRPTTLRELLKTDAGMDYARTLIDEPKATKEQILSFFTALSGKKESDIRFWTPSQSSRKSVPIRSVGLYFFVFDWFDVNGGSWFGYDDGLSRGVK
jgi:hypothetical protein